MKIGILGSGQLGKMLAEAAHNLNHEVFVYSPCSGPAFDVVQNCITATWDDQAALKNFFQSVDVVTYELEQLPLVSFESLPSSLNVFPNTQALKIAQNRFLEKSFCDNLDIPVAKFHKLESNADVEIIANTFSFPLLLKTSEGGYDGKGQKKISSATELQAVFQDWQCPCIVEEIVNWQREVSLVSTRSQSGEVVFYSPIENHHAEGILRWSLSPCEISKEQTQTLQSYAKTLLEKLDYVGTLAVEFFQTNDGFFMNEMAPRVHNSGHLTIEGTKTSQFENHIRAITGMPLGGTTPQNTAVMYNLIGKMPDPLPDSQSRNAVLHDYKKAPRPGRKLAHMTFTFEHLEAAKAHIQAFEKDFL